MQTQELFIDEASERDLVKHLHGEIVGLLTIFVEA